MNSRENSVTLFRRSVVRGSAYTLVLVLGIRTGMERKARDMMNSIRKIVENWKLGASMMGLIVLLAILLATLSTFALQSI